MLFPFTLACLWASLPVAFAQDSKPFGPVHPGQPNNCITWHTVKKGDDCDSVPKKYYISRREFMAWNPAVSKDCLENFWLKSAYCIRIDGTSAIRSSTRTITTSKTAVCTTRPTTGSVTTTRHTATSGRSTTKSFSSDTEDPSRTTSPMTTSTVNATYSVRHPVSTWNITTPTTDLSWPPKATQRGQPVTCQKWHLARGGEGCQDVLNRYSAFMKKDDFFKWNPEVHTDCSGLFVGYWYCVGIKSNATNNLQWSTSTPPFTPPPDPTVHKTTKLTPANSDFTPTPTHGSMPKDCINFHQAEADESCRDILKTYNYLSKEQFFKYNPVLKENCDGLWKGNWYCVAVKSEALMPPTVTSTPNAVPSGSSKNCTAWYYTTGGETCEQLASMFGTFSVKEFITMNPSVLDDCDEIDDNTWYCIAEPGIPTTRIADLTAPTLQETAMPTQSGTVSDCKEYWLVSKTDTCKSIRRANSISLENLVGWNLALGSKCTGLKPDSYVCVER